ncbi:riboflavin synthase subunit alpha [Candidatus Parabeggiatoa sp. HSG14]|uniref:riboflavin synthase subunit alpha n=1 Tax=Candidatus Parabeggiatoa sp. HSG14 TaxID=3055593 RepID=UPI0025A80FFB|nr:riboflavin synthase subunit alpha [Thiotrichales bacterium HSG14]
MFTGIVQAYVEVSEVIRKQDLTTFTLCFPESSLKGLKQGASVAIDGVCFTVVNIEGKHVFFDAMKETLQRTTIGIIEKGKHLNIERSFKIGDEVGGHIVSGHVHSMAEIVDVNTSIANNHILTFKVPNSLVKYIFPKGFVALNGASLTIVDVDKKNDTFSVYLIPETLQRTTFGFKEKGDFVNIEIDSQTQAIVDTVERVLAEKNIVVKED